MIQILVQDNVLIIICHEHTKYLEYLNISHEHTEYLEYFILPYETTLVFHPRRNYNCTILDSSYAGAC